MRLGASRFVAGETLDECIAVLRRLNDQGLWANTTLLGEGVLSPTQTENVVAAYREIIDRIAAEQLRANVALKLTHLGLEIDEELAYANVRGLVEHATEREQFIRIDMEQSEFVDATLRIYRRLREDGLDRVGTVLQSYLYRTPADLESLLPLEPNLRLVKGAYLEPESVAYPRKADVDAAYVRLLERMLSEAGHTAVATHDSTSDPARDPLRRRPRHPEGPLRVPDALRRPAAAAARPRPPRLQGARRDAVRARVVPVPDAAPRRAAGEPALLRQEHAARIGRRTRVPFRGAGPAQSYRLGDHDRRRAGAFVLAFEAEVAKPYRIPSSSMEPTLHCAKPGAWCEARFSDRVIVNRLAYRFSSPKRGQIVVFHAPPAADNDCGEGGTFVKRLIGLPGETVSEQRGVISIDGKPLQENYVLGRSQDTTVGTWRRAEGPLLLHGRRPGTQLRLAHVGLRAPQQPRRPAVPHLLAALASLTALIALTTARGSRRRPVTTASRTAAAASV